MAATPHARIVTACSGFDGSQEELMHTCGCAALERGYYPFSHTKAWAAAFEHRLAPTILIDGVAEMLSAFATGLRVEMLRMLDDEASTREAR